ncbi:hypothetical protein ACFVYT_37250 [Streptomyces sp. NPDC058290]|uniref:hypothetical protein n=1 Tax=Streptomyces sp. NPDC058290 TaxID=3346426 RepID=UPI0036E6298B
MTVVSAVVAFVVCLWVARSASFGWLPKAEADRWVVATAFATVGATAVAAAVGWWAGQTPPPAPTPAPAPAPAPLAAPPPPARKVTQTAKASGRGRISQTGGSLNGRAAAAAPADPDGPVTIRQDASATDDGQVDQAASDLHTERPKP